MLYTKFKAPILILSATAAIFSLQACSRPNSFPTGYVYHDKAFKSANPPVSPKFSEEQRETMGPEQSDQFRLAIYKLVEELTNRAGMPPKPIYVLRPDRFSSFYANVDNDLRESLRHIGYKLSDKPDGAYVFTYKAKILEKPKNAPVTPGEPNVNISLQVYDKMGEGSKMLTEQAGDFYITGAEKMTAPFAWFPGVPYKQ